MRLGSHATGAAGALESSRSVAVTTTTPELREVVSLNPTYWEVGMWH